MRRLKVFSYYYRAVLLIYWDGKELGLDPYYRNAHKGKTCSIDSAVYR
jgi:hypothetical protein